MKKHAVVLFVLVALLGAACSASAEPDTSTVAADTQSSSGSEPTDVPEPTAVPETTDVPQATAAPEPTAVPEATEVPEPAGAAAAYEDQEPVATVDTSGASSLLVSDDWCTAAAQVDGVLDVTDLDDPASLEESYGAAVALVAEAAQIAPPPIAADVALMSQAMVRFSSLLEEAEWSFLDVDLAAIEEVAVGMDVPGYNIEKYNYEVCGIGEDPGDAPDLSFDDLDEPLPQGSARDLIVDSLVTSGFTETEALCLAEALDFTDPETALADPTALLEVFDTCGISLDRLSQLGG